MKRFVFAAAAVAVAAAAYADLTLHPIQKAYRASYAYSAATGTFERVAKSELDGLRTGEIFDSSEGTGYFSSQDDGFGGWDVWLDWGDVASLSETFDEFTFDYYLDAGDPIDRIVNFYTEDNGFNDTDRVPIDATYTGGILFTGLPGSPNPDPNACCSGWLITVDMVGSGFNTTIAGSDKDGIAGADFSYTYTSESAGAATLLGPSLSNPPGAEGDPDPVTGVESAFDIFSPDLSDPNLNYLGTFWFGPPPAPYAQFYLVLSAAAPGCPSGLPTDCDTDIVGDTAGSAPNCKIDLTDLSVLLSNFGQTGQTFFDGDVHPVVLGGTADGDVDLDDLSQMLVDFGNNCQ